MNNEKQKNIVMKKERPVVIVIISTYALLYSLRKLNVPLSSE